MISKTALTTLMTDDFNESGDSDDFNDSGDYDDSKDSDPLYFKTS